MSHRGSKRRQVVQLDNSTSNLHHYDGYTKSITSSEKEGSSLKLVGDYSDSDTDEDVSDAEKSPALTDPEVQSNNAVPDDDDPPADPVSIPNDEAVDTPDKELEAIDGLPSSMDDELKNFLSEIEAIPMPPDLQAVADQSSAKASPQADSPSPVQEPVIEETAEPSDVDQSSLPSATVKKSEKKRSKYSMFIKGDTEFVDPSAEKKAGDQGDKADKEKEPDFPEEPTTQWQLVQDEATQYYYYWNMVTNQVTWEIPADYTQYLLLHKEFEEKMAKFSPEQMEIYNAKQKLKKNASGEINTTSGSSLGPEVQGPQFPNGNSTDVREEDYDSRSHSSHSKKKKSHKKHKKRRHNDEDEHDERFEGPMKPPADEPHESSKHLPLPQPLSIVPYLSDDDENENNEESTALSTKDAISEKPTQTKSAPVSPKENNPDSEKSDQNKANSAPVSPRENTDSVTSLQEVKKEVEAEQPVESKDLSPDSKDEEATEIQSIVDHSEAKVLTPPVSPTEPEEPAESHVEEELTGKDEEADIENETGDANDSSENGVNLRLYDLCADSESGLITNKDEEENSQMSCSSQTEIEEKCQETTDGNNIQEDMPSPEPENLISGPENIKVEVEEGEISDSNESALKSKRLEGSQSLFVPARVDSPKIDSSHSEIVHEKKAVGNLLNLIGYKSGDDEEEEGELREDISPLKRKLEIIQKEVSEEREIPSSDKHKSREERKKKKKKSTKQSEKSIGPCDFKETSHDFKEAPHPSSETIASSPVVDDVDIDFDDLEDIDRVLELALEKKLDKKKVDEAAGQHRSSVEVPDVKGKESTEIEDGPKPSDEKEDKVDKHSQVNSCSKDKEELEVKIKAMADLALNKLDFLDIGVSTFSKLQTLYIELQTRLKDWTGGGLSTEYFYKQLQHAEGLLEQYEVNAVPDGWQCQWDRLKGRYFYRNTVTNQIQLEYPQIEKRTNKEEPKHDGDRRRRERESSEVEESHKQHSSSSRNRHRRKDEKDRGKRDRRSSDRHSRKKRRRRRAHSSSSESSNEASHQHHHKSKRKKKRKAERSPSIEVIGDREHVPHIIEDSPPSAPSITTSLVHVFDENSVDSTYANALTAAESARVSAAASTSQGLQLAAGYLSEPEGEKTDDEPTNANDNDIDGMKIEEEEEEMEEEKPPEEENSSAVISKPPQIIARPHIVAANPPELYSMLPTPGNTITALPSQPTTTNEITEETTTKTEEVDKAGKKKKKEKSAKEKPLATGSSLMMKKKRVSSMVQKWQRVKKEVEKEDLAKELRQAAIREQINQLNQQK